MTNEERINGIKRRWARKRWKTEAPEYTGEDWLVADCSCDMDGNRWVVTTDGVRASEHYADAQSDAEDIAAAPDDVRFLLELLEAAR